MKIVKSILVVAVVVYAAAIFLWWRSAYTSTPQSVSAAVSSPAATSPPVVPAPAPVDSSRTFRVLHVMSYHADWTVWTMAQFDAFKKELRDANVEYRVVELDAKRNDSLEKMQPLLEEARQIIGEWKPDLVYITDDAAIERLVKDYAGGETPFVFSGVNRDLAHYGIEGAANVTGVLEREHIVQTVQLFSSIAPHAKRLAIITDSGDMWPGVIQRFRDAESQLPLEIVAADIVQTYQEYQQRMLEYQSTADVVCTLGVFNFKDESGQNVPFEQVQQWTYENVNLPQISFWDSRPPVGVLCVVAVSAKAQGEAAGKIAHGILIEGKSPADYSIEPTLVGRPIINVAVAKHLGLTPPSGVLLSSEVIQTLDWAKK